MIRRLAMWIVAGGAVFLCQVALAGAHKDLTAPEVKQLMEVDSAVLVHVLSRIEYEMQHIPGSINIPITEMALTDRLPGQLDRPLIFYCMGER